MGVLFAGGFLLVGAQGVAYYFPRRRLDLRTAGGRLVVRVRGERFDDAQSELPRLSSIVARAVSRRAVGA